MRTSAPFQKGSDVFEDIRERWETSDSPLVHRIQDMQEGLFTETEQAEAYRAIRRRQPEFNINGFLAEVRRDVPAVLGAYLKGDLEALRGTNISPEMLERMGGQMRVWQSEQQFVDPEILHLSELELVEVRMMDGDPLVVLQFSCQQINCVRNGAARSWTARKTTSRPCTTCGPCNCRPRTSSRPTAASTPRRRGSYGRWCSGA